MKPVLRLIVRFSVVWIMQAMSLVALSWITPGVTLQGTDDAGILTIAMSAALVLAIMNSLVRPVLILLTLPLNVRTFGFFTLVINAAMLMLTSWALPYFEVRGWLAALIGTLVLTAVNTVLGSLTTIDDDYSFFDGVAQWLSKRQRISSLAEAGRGLVMLEIDGLSYPTIQRAIARGYMPTVRALLDDGTHALSAYDCGVPSQTSSCQAGIMYGDNFDIPAFRWYEKDRGRLMVSNHFHDAAEMNARYAHGHGLLRGGSSINNLMAGDALKSIFTMSVLRDDDADVKRRRAEDFYLFWLNPYLFTRSLVLTLWDVIVELWEGLRQRIRNVRPRMNRLHKAYPILRAIVNVFLRDLGTYMVILDVIRGVPALYTTYVGYDEVAHHAGPDTPDALDTLRGLDKQLRRILDVLQRKAWRPYDVILLSDHGQSLGATFEQRYGYTLTEFIQEQARQATVAEVNATENSQGHAAALLAEIEGLERRVAMSRLRQATIGRLERGLRSLLRHVSPSLDTNAEVIVCASGNLANVYFQRRPGKIGLDELNTAYPGLIDALVQHPGVGLVIGYDAAGAPLALGKAGARNLLTGAVVGVDPLLPYGDPERRAQQLLRLAQFPHAGDLIVNSPVYPDGQVAAYEELVGSHGGLGGPQTDAFLLHPADMAVPPTSNAADVFALLDARRGLPGQPLQPRAKAPAVDAWSPRTLWAGLRDMRTWVPRAARALFLNRAAFREVADDPYATGPALLILLAVQTLTSLSVALDPDIPGRPLVKLGVQVGVGALGWLLAVFLAYVAGRLLRGTGDFTRTLRAMTFAQAPHFIGVLALAPMVGGLFPLVASLMVLVATWLALQEALKLRGLLVALIPIVVLLVVIGATLAGALMFSGASLTVEQLLLHLGLTPAL